MKRNKVMKLLRRKRLRAVKGGLAFLTGRTTNHEASKETSDSISSQTNNQTSNGNQGILRQDGDKLRLPTALADAGESENEGLMPSGLAFFIIILAVAFIAIVAWQISEMPAAR